MKLYNASDLVIGKVYFENDFRCAEELIFEKKVLDSKAVYKSISNGSIYFVNLGGMNFIDVVETNQFSMLFPDISSVSRSEAKELESLINAKVKLKVLSRSFS